MKNKPKCIKFTGCGLFIDDFHRENISNMFRIECTNANIGNIIQTETIKFQNIHSKVLKS